MTAPNLSLPDGAIASFRRQLLQPRPVAEMLQPRVAAFVGLLAVVLASEIANTPQHIDLHPGVPLAVAVIVVAALGGLRAGLLAAAFAVAYALFFYTRPAAVAVDGNGLRVLVFTLSVPALAALIGSLRDRLDAVTAQPLREMADRVRDFSDEISHARAEALPKLVVTRGAAMAAADMAVLTIIDRRTQRHVVRAVHGSTRALVGMEVLPGIGLAGRALREQRAVVVGRPADPPLRRPGDVHARLVALLAGVPAHGRPARGVAPAIALPLRHAGSVVATLTLGRADVERPFTDDEQRLIELVAPQIALAIANGLLRGQLRQASLRDSLTGLFNRAYLDAALDQLLARRRRLRPAERPPLSLLQVAIDGLGELDEKHGSQAADQVVRAVAALLRQRFRHSDTIARVEPDAFVVVLDDSDLAATLRVANHIRDRAQEMSLPDNRGGRLPVSVSVGCATFDDDTLRSDDLVRTVAAAFDTARWSGPGSVVSI